MPLWMLWLFALCMISAVLSFSPLEVLAELATIAFVVTAVIFLARLIGAGVRRPVV